MSKQAAQGKSLDVTGKGSEVQRQQNTEPPLSNQERISLEQQTGVQISLAFNAFNDAARAED